MRVRRRVTSTAQIISQWQSAEYRCCTWTPELTCLSVDEQRETQPMLFIAAMRIISPRTSTTQQNGICRESPKTYLFFRHSALSSRIRATGRTIARLPSSGRSETRAPLRDKIEGGLIMRRIIAILAFAALENNAAAQEHAHGSTSEKIGTVRFATSCSAAVQPQFDRAVTLLHSFEFGASIKGFESVLAADPTCAMAYWGIAMSRWSNPMAAGNRPADQLARGRSAVDSAMLVSSHATERERQYIAAVAELYKDFERTPQEARI